MAELKKFKEPGHFARFSKEQFNDIAELHRPSVDPTVPKVIQPLDVDYDAIRSSNPHRMVHGVEARLIRLRQQVINVWTAVRIARPLEFGR